MWVSNEEIIKHVNNNSEESKVDNNNFSLGFCDWIFKNESYVRLIQTLNINNIPYDKAIKELTEQIEHKEEPMYLNFALSTKTPAEYTGILRQKARIVFEVLMK